MPHRFKILLTLALFALSFAALGKAPRMPERSGGDTLEASRRESSLRVEAT